MAEPEPQPAEKPESVQAVGQSRGRSPTDASATDPGRTQLGEDKLYEIDPRVLNAERTQLYERVKGDPVYRPLEIFALNPEVSKLEGGVVSLSIPYEPLEVGPVGSVIQISTETNVLGPPEYRTNLSKADLEAPFNLMQGGYRASLSQPEFHQQMVYAVAMLTYTNFSQALGRNIAWGFAPPNDPTEPNRLTLHPHGIEEENAWYDPARKEIVFGYFIPKTATPVVPDKTGYLFTSVSHDVIAHEMSHALLDSLRPSFARPTHCEVLAFHEAFADLIAFFQHFTFKEVVKAQLGKSKGRLENAKNLIDIAQEFGRGLGLTEGALRTVYDTGDAANGAKITLDSAKADNEGPHHLGRVLVYAVFDAFLKIYNRKTRRYIKLATGGTGTLPEGDISSDLEDFLAESARGLAGQFLKICIRAIDYCPPVDVRFGDYLRAMITADRDVVPDDKWGYREAIIQAFGARGIFGEGTASMTEEALNWHEPTISIEPQKELQFGNMAFDGDPARPAAARAMHVHAGVVGRLASRVEHAEEFGLISPRSSEFLRGDYDLPVVTSVRQLRRVGPDAQLVFDTVAEVVQTRRVACEGVRLTLDGGSTVVFGPRGNVRYIIRKRVNNDERATQQALFAQGRVGQQFWKKDGQTLTVDTDSLKKLCLNCDCEH